MENRGFTLVELLITIVIVAILTAIALPQFANYRERAVVSKVQGDLVGCAGELLAEFADKGTLNKTCTTSLSNDTCILEIIRNNGRIKIANDYCIFNVKGTKVKCEIETQFGNVNGFIRCYKVAP